ncbi:MAG: sulfatase-like hydrolase/transferase [Planctomycetaceae bacterium]|nr:sulfatase-like hydrolase/transferase [Planctomycetaceae bacterium]
MIFFGLLTVLPTISGAEPPRPNIVLVMADDQGWGQVGYYNHPTLKTPNLDAMAKAGLRFDRFYAAGPVCSPTRASVLTGRTHVRTGVPSHGHNLCLQEKTLPSALNNAGYATGHFGKWHLNGIRGPGVPILGDDANHPGMYGFDEWLSVTNFFDRNPILSRNGRFEEFEGDSSVIIVEEALKFISRQQVAGEPSFTVIWYGSPHNPMRAVEEDLDGFDDNGLGNHLGEIRGIDRSVGKLRAGLRDLGIEKETLVWYCSDNGGLTVDPDACGHLRGHKGQVYEGGIRVPGIIEWPGTIEPGITIFPASTMDIMPTLIELLELPEDSQLAVRDGESILPLLRGEKPTRTHPIPFLFGNSAALIDGKYKILSTNINQANEWKLFNLEQDPGETNDLSEKSPEKFETLKAQAASTIQSIEVSAAGKDYPEGEVLQPARRDFWYHMQAYQPHFERFFQRPEYAGSEKKVPPSLR